MTAVVTKHGQKIQKLTGVSFKNSLTESSLACCALRKFLKKYGKVVLHTKK